MLWFATALLTLPLAVSPQALEAVAAGTVRVFLVRHGQAFSNLQPTPDLPPERLDRLTELGREQSRRAGAFLRGQNVALVLSSPAGRARETAEEIRSALGSAPLEVEPRLRPLELGRSPADAPLDWDDRIAEWTAGRDPSPEGGESLDQLGRRVRALVASLSSKHAGRSVVLVAHSEVIGAFVGLVKGVPPAKRWPPRVANGSLTTVEARPGEEPRLIFESRVPPEPASATP